MLFSIEQATKTINAEIKKLQLPAEPENLYDPFRYLLGLGGKRLRPLLVLMSHSLYSDNQKAAVLPALAVEVFHNFTLVHDDIMDQAPIRRGKATVHEKWNTNTAILSGDVMLIKAYDLLLQAPAAVMPQVLRSFNICATQVCEGQQMDMDFETRTDVVLEEYLQMIKYKTAVLLGFATELGALIGGANGQDVDLIREFAVNIGVVFQLKDDLLDVFGEGSKTGKQVGGDILTRKKTFLLIQAMTQAKADDKAFLHQYLSREVPPDQSDVDAVKQIYIRAGVEKTAQQYIQGYLNKGLHTMTRVQAPLHKKKMVKDFVINLVARES